MTGLSLDVDGLRQFKMEMSDVKIFGGGGTRENPIPAHKVILGIKSPYFLQLFNSSKDQPNNEVQIPEIPHSTLGLLIEQVHLLGTSVLSKLTEVCTQGTYDEVISLITGAKLLMLTEVTQICDEALMSVRIGEGNNCLELLQYGDLLGSSHLVEKILDFIENCDQENIDDLIATRAFLHVNGKLIRRLLSKISSSCTPRQLLQMIINWWKHDGPGRKEFAEEFLEMVPWSQMNPEIIIEILVKNTDDQLKLLLFEPLIRQFFKKFPSLPIQAQHYDHPSSQLNKSAFLETLQLGPVSTTLSSPSNESKPLIRKRSQRENTPSKTKKLRCTASRRRSGRSSVSSLSSESSLASPSSLSSEWSSWSLTSRSSSTSSSSDSSGVNRVSSTTTSEPKSHCIMYFMGKYVSTIRSPKYYIQSFDLETGHSTILKSCSEQCYTTLVYHDNSIYIFGAETYETVETRKITVVDGETDILDLKDDEPTWRNTSSIPPMEFPIYDFRAAIWSDTIYAFGGAYNLRSGQEFSVVNTIIQFSPHALTKGWTPLQGVNSQRKCASSIAVVGNKIYSIGGFVMESDEADCEVSDKVECFDPAQNSCVLKANLPEALVGVATAVLGSKIFAFGGGKTYKPRRRKSALVYDTETDTWSSIQPMTQYRAFGSAIGYNGCVFAIGGDLKSTIEKYDPKTGQWKMWKHRLPSGGDFRSVAFNLSEV